MSAKPKPPAKPPTRRELQNMAKKAGIRANQTSEDIQKALLRRTMARSFSAGRIQGAFRNSPKRKSPTLASSSDVWMDYASPVKGVRARYRMCPPGKERSPKGRCVKVCPPGMERSPKGKIRKRSPPARPRNASVQQLAFRNCMSARIKNASFMPGSPHKQRFAAAASSCKQ